MAQSAWKPAVMADLESISGNAFKIKLAQFAAWSATQPPLPSELPVKNGWCDITPQIAEELLRRNLKNRPVALETVKKYARRMKAGAWRKTGQPGLLCEGVVYDMQHRLWAGYLSGITFPSYMITDVPPQDDLFAYIDDNKARSPADALATAGNNGISPTIASAIKLAWRYEHRALAIVKNPPIRAMDNIEVLDYSRQYPEIGMACHDVHTNHERAEKIIGNKGVAGFSAYKMQELHGYSTYDEFMSGLGSGANLDDASPILALRNRLIEADQKSDDLKPLHILALVIRALNMHVEGQDVGKKRGLFIADNEDYPLFEDINPTVQAAE